jgi:hypothetical protein
MKFFIKKLPNTITSVDYFAYSTFGSTPDAKKVLSRESTNYGFPSSITSASSVFSHSRIRSIGTELFKGCVALEDVSHSFWNCSKLSTIPVTIFQDCIGLRNL